MGRIEEALAKLQRGQTKGGRGSPASPLGQVRERPGVTDVQQQNYGGKFVEVKFDELRSQGLLAPDGHQRKLAEEFRIAKRPLLKNANVGRDPLLPRGNLLLIASALSGEGKTFTGLNLALSIAREPDWSVVLVDADMKKPHLTRLFGADREPGFTEVLRKSGGFDSFVMPTNVPGFALMPGGTLDENASELLAGDAMSALCESISKSDPHRIVIFDSGPLLLTSEAAVLSAHVGQVLLVVQAGKTLRREVQTALDLIDPDQPAMMLLNQAPEHHIQYGHYGYGDADSAEDRPAQVVSS